MQLRTLRLSVVLIVAALVIIFFVPLVPYRIQEVCPSFFCGLIPSGGFATGFNSLGLLFFDWGASLDTSLGWITYVPPIISITRGDVLTAFGVWIFVLLPIILLMPFLLLPEEWRIISAGLCRVDHWLGKSHGTMISTDHEQDSNRQ